MYAKILVPIDGSNNADQALAEAIRLAKSLGSQIKVMHVITTASQQAGALPEEAIRAGNTLLADAKHRIEAAGVSGLTLLVDKPVAPDDVPATIINMAHERHAELVVIGADGKLGRVAETVMNQCPLPVWIIRGKQSDAKKA